jgi:N4-gp56 family major capsid protein
MPGKTSTDQAKGGGFPATPDGNVDLASNSNYNKIFNDNSNELRTQVWSELVTRDAREKNVLSKFIGSEGSGNPIVEKRDLGAGGSDKVVFTTVAPIRGQGVRGEEILKNSTGSLDFGTFNVEVDLIRHAVAWTQVLKLMRFTGKTIDQLSAEVMSEWAGRTEQDHIQTVLRDTCRKQGASNTISAYGTGANGALEYKEGLSTDIIQEAKQALISQGGEPMREGSDSNQSIPGYLFFAPDACLRPLRSDPDYLEAITQADARGENNKLYSGNYARWDNNIIANHNVILDTAKGRQGSPLLPTHIFDKALVNGNADLSGGTITGEGDAFANFALFDPRIPGGGGAEYKHDINNTEFILIRNASDGKLGVYSYTGNTGATLTTVARVNGLTLEDAGANDLDKGDDVWDSGSLVVQCNAIGTPIGHALALGEKALYYAKGAVFNEQIFHYDDFSNSGNDSHLSAVGIQSVYGMAAYQDTKKRVPGAQLVECVRQIPGLSLVQS